METVTLAPLEPAAAFALLQGVEARDPRGVATRADLWAMCERGACYAATLQPEGGQAVYVIRMREGLAWIEAAKGSGPVSMLPRVLPAIELQAMACGQRAAGFQTARRGLVRQAQRAGWSVAGWIMRKELAPWT